MSNKNGESGCLGQSSYDWYRITILMICYGFGEYGHYLLGVVSTPLTQDLEFGEQSCVYLNLDVESRADRKCKEFKNVTEFVAQVEDQAALCRVGEEAITEDDLKRLALIAGFKDRVTGRKVPGRRTMIYGR